MNVIVLEEMTKKRPRKSGVKGCFPEKLKSMRKMHLRIQAGIEVSISSCQDELDFSKSKSGKKSTCDILANSLHLLQD